MNDLALAVTELEHVASALLRAFEEVAPGVLPGTIREAAQNKIAYYSRLANVPKLERMGAQEITLEQLVSGDFSWTEGTVFLPIYPRREPRVRAAATEPFEVAERCDVHGDTLVSDGHTLVCASCVRASIAQGDQYDQTLLDRLGIQR